MKANKRQKMATAATEKATPSAAAMDAAEVKATPSAIATKVMQCTDVRELLQTFADYPENKDLPNAFYLRGGWKFAHLSVGNQSLLNNR